MNEFLFLFQKLVILDYIIRNTGTDFHILLHLIETLILGTKWIFICIGLFMQDFHKRLHVFFISNMPIRNMRLKLGKN